MEERPEYKTDIEINGCRLKRIIIDQHYQLKHPELNDELIVTLVEELDGGEYPIDETKGRFQYFKVEPVECNNLPYRLILLLCKGDDFIGVINAFRIKRRK